MPYVLGIDIGSTTTAATVARRRGASWARPETVALDTGAATVPSVLHLGVDGTLVVGESGTDDGSRTARGFLHRVGDDVPLLLAGEACPPHLLTAVLATWVVERVLAREGEPADAVVLSHPAGWGRHRRELLHNSLWELGMSNVTLLPRTVTVAEGHAARGFAGSTAVVYALGGESFEAALVRRNAHGRYETLGLPQGLDWIGGSDFDEALAEHVRTTLARELAAAGRRETYATLRALRPECERAKRELTVGTETDVLLNLPAGPTRVPVTRAQFEEMIRPAVQATVDLLLRTVLSAGLRAADLDAVLLTGGSTRIPLVAELLTAALPVPVEVEPDPQLTAATGAALAACQVVSPRPRPSEPPRAPAPTADARHDVVPGPHRHPGPAVPAPRRPDHDRMHHAEPPPRPPIRITPLELPRASRLVLSRGRGREG
ncbi:Hsp70 family protein [Micromonospora musae]|uniref:Hsp70 family protein n=1 Tax=Micromonospora musae TaxID=1894970 RepID=A0ABX9RMC5_9ACTN|nr:Hsp70 family protein [Micromonospora musae]RKN23805.1 Hsp70 family protein [Micromonospora musae]